MLVRWVDGAPKFSIRSEYAHAACFEARGHASASKIFVASASSKNGIGRGAVDSIAKPNYIDVPIIVQFCFLKASLSCPIHIISALTIVDPGSSCLTNAGSANRYLRARLVPLETNPASLAAGKGRFCAEENFA